MCVYISMCSGINFKCLNSRGVHGDYMVCKIQLSSLVASSSVYSMEVILLLLTHRLLLCTGSLCWVFFVIYSKCVL